MNNRNLLTAAAAIGILASGAHAAASPQQDAPAAPSADARSHGSWEGFMEDRDGDQFITLILSAPGAASEGTLQVLGQNIAVSGVSWNGDRVTARAGAAADDLTIDARRENGSLVGQLKQGTHVQRFVLRAIPDYPAPRDRVAGWAQDLDVLATRFINLDLSFTPGERTMFLEAIENIRRELPTLDDAQVTMRMASAIALADNAHTRLLLLRNATKLRRLPIRLWWFSDGLYVIRTTPEYRHLLGCRVETIGGTNVRLARDIVGRAFAGNPSWRDYMSVYSLTSPEALRGMGIIEDTEQVELGVSGCSGASRRVVRPAPLARSDRTVEAWWDLSPLRENPHGASAHPLAATAATLPLYLRHPDSYYWFEYLSEPGILYFQYNRADQARDEDTNAFGQRLLAQIERQRPQAVVIDVRFNTGGDLGLARDLLRRLRERTRGIPAYIITSRSTFSAGISNVAMFRAGGPVTIVGEPAGDGLDHWSEGGYIQLPYSGLEVDFNTGFHSYSPSSCPAAVRCVDLNVTSIQPDVPAELSWAAYIAGRDPSMEAIMAHLSGEPASGIAAPAPSSP